MKPAVEGQGRPGRGKKNLLHREARITKHSTGHETKYVKPLITVHVIQQEKTEIRRNTHSDHNEQIITLQLTVLRLSLIHISEPTRPY